MATQTLPETSVGTTDKNPGTKYVYSFGGGSADGNGRMKDTLGGKGAGLAEMTNAGLPVPPGFTIQTEACREYMRGGLAPDVDKQMDEALAKLEALQGQMLGNVVLDIEKSAFEEVFDAKKKQKKTKLDTDLDAKALQEVIVEYKKVVKQHTKHEFPQDPHD